MCSEVLPRFLPAGETALVVEFGTTIDAGVNDRVRALDRALAAQRIDGIVETVPTYRSLMIHFDPRILSTATLIARIRGLEPEPDDAGPAPAHWLIPICYDEPYAEDLTEVAAELHLSEKKVVALHVGATYRVYMYGFAPGYIFLGGLPAELAISRRATPRPPVPRGSVLIAGGQALIASVAMPTGWYNLGSTPAALFDPRRTPEFIVDIGDRVTFEPIDAATYAALRQSAAEGNPIVRRKT